MASSVGFLPLGWKLQSIDEYTAVYRFEGDTEFLGVRRQLTFPLIVTRVIEEVSVVFPTELGNMSKTHWFENGRKARKFISSKMYWFTRRFYGLKPKRRCLFKVVLPNGSESES